MLQLRQRCWLVLQGLPWLHPKWFTKLHFVGYEPKDTKIKFRFMASFSFSILSAGVLGNGFWESDEGVWGAVVYRLSLWV